MKKMMVKVIGMALCIVMLAGIIPVTTLAVQSNTISAETVSANPGDTIKIPIKISENTGLMGFSINFSFDASALEIVDVEKSDVLSAGMFDDSVGTGKNNYFKVIWCDTQNITKNGELFTLTFKVLPNATGNEIIKVAYDSKDTFNEKWESVELNCNDITVAVNNGGNVNPVQPTFWQKIGNFFAGILKWIRGLFVK